MKPVRIDRLHQPRLAAERVDREDCDGILATCGDLRAVRLDQAADRSPFSQALRLPQGGDAADYRTNDRDYPFVVGQSCG
jgi:hypothetical protein